MECLSGGDYCVVQTDKKRQVLCDTNVGRGVCDNWCFQFAHTVVTTTQSSTAIKIQLYPAQIGMKGSCQQSIIQGNFREPPTVRKGKIVH